MIKRLFGILVWVLLYADILLTPVKWLLKMIRRITLRYPAFALSLVLGSLAVLIIDKLVVGQLDPQVFVPVLILVIIGFFAMITAMWPAGIAPEVRAVDHKSAPSRWDIAADI